MQHELTPYFDELAQFPSSPALERSNLYRSLQPEIDRVLDHVVVEHHTADAPAIAKRPTIRVTAWNIERGIKVDGIIAVLRDHPVIADSDIFLLTELDHGMARSANRIIASDIATALGLNYVFVPSYLSLVKGSGLEYDVDGENTLALHGNAVFSRYPVRDPISVPLTNGKDLMAGKEKRLGCQRAAVATVDHPLGPLRVASVHLDAHASRRHRHLQMCLLLDAIEQQDALPVVVGGDWNTSTYNSHRALTAILGFWRRVFMGVTNVVKNHYPYPDRKFERPLFAELESRGYRYRDVNELGVGTLHYDMSDHALNTNLADWVPQLCFPFIRWAMREVGGRCSLKLDWFAVRGLSLAPNTTPKVHGDVHTSAQPLSDHDPIVVDLIPD